MKRKSAPKDAKANNSTNNSTPPTKHELALVHMLDAGTNGISKLTALPDYGELSLPTTISELCAIGFFISRESREHRHQHGGNTRFHWYWLRDHSEALRAAVHVNKLRQKRQATALDDLLIERYLEGFL